MQILECTKRHQLHSDSQTIVKSGEAQALLMKHARFDSELKVVYWQNEFFVLFFLPDSALLKTSEVKDSYRKLENDQEIWDFSSRKNFFYQLGEGIENFGMYEAPPVTLQFPNKCEVVWVLDATDETCTFWLWTEIRSLTQRNFYLIFFSQLFVTTNKRSKR